MRQVFDLMPRDGEEAWRNIASRMALIPDGIASYRRTLEEGLERGLVVAKRQAVETAAQCDIWNGADEGHESFFNDLVSEFANSNIASEGLRRELEDAAVSANSGIADMAIFLRYGYIPHATDRDAVGEERYSLGARVYNGMELDLRDTYQWGWEQLAWVDSEMERTAEKIAPGKSVEEVIRILDTDPDRSIEGVDEFRQWMQDLQDRTIAELNGVHFDIADPVKKIEAMIAPPGGALAMYYTQPSEDFSRPGRTWYPTGGKTRFRCGARSQSRTMRVFPDTISSLALRCICRTGFRDSRGFWAERRDTRRGGRCTPSGLWGNWATWTTRTTISECWRGRRSGRCASSLISGCTWELEIPGDQPFYPGERWNRDLGLEFIKQKGRFPEDFVTSEVSRYLGIPGQAISYKVGEREWLSAREESKRKLGADFDLKEWHTRALSLGPMGLGQMRRELR